MPGHGRRSQLIVEVSVEPGRNQALDPGEILGLSVERDRLGEQPHDPAGKVPLIVGRQLGEDVGEEGPLHQLRDELVIARAYWCEREQAIKQACWCVSPRVDHW